MQNSIKDINFSDLFPDLFRKYKTAIIIFVKILIASGLLYYVTSSVNLNEIFTAIENANLFMLSAAVILLLANVYLQYWKWEVVCRDILNETNKKKILISLFYGLSAGSFTPVRIGEYFGRAIMFKNKSFIQLTVATLIDKFFLMIIVAFFGALASILFVHYYYGITAYITIALFVTIFLLFYLLIFLVINPNIWKKPILKRIYASTKFKRVIKKFAIIKKLNKDLSLKLGIISALFFLCILIQYVLLASAFSNQFDPKSFLWAGMLIFFTKTIIPPISIADLGVREGASIFFLSVFGYSSAIGFNSSIFLFFINILIPAVFGLFLLLKKNNA
ncbi:MAG TPA: lysylphosphatidylglycerol synthase transmembrane domain-containing protein [Ignavibacteriaceae bacterium]|nr:lysylphosphatidylglycerol synthase transmembrane domain-containing protein [Ignavibacteriaceae bacterium]